MRSSWWKAALLAACGCNLASGLDEFGVAPQTSAASSGGSGGAPELGGAGGQPPRPCAVEPRDDFEDGVIAPHWTVMSGFNGVAETGGVLSVSVPAMVSDWWGLVTSTERYVLDGCGAVVQHAGQLPSGGAASFYLADLAGNRIGFIRVAGELRCQYKLAGADAVNVQRPAYDADGHRWWWVRPNGDVTEWYVSNDGVSWKLIASAESVVDPATLELRLSVGVLPTAISGGFAVAFDNVNMTP